MSLITLNQLNTSYFVFIILTRDCWHITVCIVIMSVKMTQDSSLQIFTALLEGGFHFYAALHHQVWDSILQCTLCTAYSALYTVQCILSTVNCALYTDTAHCTKSCTAQSAPQATLYTMSLPPTIWPLMSTSPHQSDVTSDITSVHHYIPGMSPHPSPQWCHHSTSPHHYIRGGITWKLYYKDSQHSLEDNGGTARVLVLCLRFQVRFGVLVEVGFL